MLHLWRMKGSTVKPDPMETVTSESVPRPRSRGPGSGKAAWVRFAEDMADANGKLWEVVKRQSQVIPLSTSCAPKS